MAGAALLAAYAAAATSADKPLLEVVGLVGVVALAAALGFRRPALIAPALVILGGEYAALFLSGGGAIDERAPLYGVLFFLVAELAFAALELRAGTPEPGLCARRVATLIGLAILGVVGGTFTLAAASVPVGGGVGLEAIGVVAAVAVLALLGRLARA